MEGLFVETIIVIQHNQKEKVSLCAGRASYPLSSESSASVAYAILRIDSARSKGSCCVVNPIRPEIPCLPVTLGQQGAESLPREPSNEKVSPLLFLVVIAVFSYAADPPSAPNNGEQIDRVCQNIHRSASTSRSGQSSAFPM